MTERLGCVAFVIQQTGLLIDAVIDQTDVEPTVRHLKFRRHKRQTMRITVDDRRDLDRVFHRFQADPDTREPRQGPAVQPVIHHLLDPCGADHRHVAVDHRKFGLVQHGRGFARVVIPHRHQHAAIHRRAGHIGVTHHIPGPVHTRPLAVPQTKDTIVFALTAQLGLLGTPNRCGGKVFVQAGLKRHIALHQLLFRALHLHVDGTQRRSAIARHQPCRVQPRRFIAGLLHHGHAHQRLRAV